LPASPESAKKDAESHETMASGTGYILIMDDEEFIRKLVAEMLKKIYTLNPTRTSRNCEFRD
jgi:hypothetical protein